MTSRFHWSIASILMTPTGVGTKESTRRRPGSIASRFSSRARWTSFSCCSVTPSSTVLTFTFLAIHVHLLPGMVLHNVALVDADLGSSEQPTPEQPTSSRFVYRQKYVGSLIPSQLQKEPERGFEPLTCSLRVSRS